jgi:ADP-ribosyl-[dinitrogen reductase] hydrolase
MTLFTLEGLLRAKMRYHHKGITSVEHCVLNAYIRWLGTQGFLIKNAANSSYIYSGWLWKQDILHSQRAPGNACLSSLKHYVSQENYSMRSEPINNSKGSGSIMRMAPVGFFDFDCFYVGCELAKLTHGHPSGYLASGFIAQLIHEIIENNHLKDAIELAKSNLLQCTENEEVLLAVSQALDFAENEEAIPETIEKLGGGWVAEEALAISLFCAIKAKSFKHGIQLAVNHSGDSDSTGAITGNILGSIWGQSNIPVDILHNLELRDIIEQMASDVMNFEYTDEWWERYPGA